MFTVTNTSMLVGLRDQKDDKVWSEFHGRYFPLLVSFGRRLGLTEQDAEDAAQEALLAFAVSYREGRYDRDKGRLRTWLSGIATNKIRDIQRRRGRDVAVGEGDATTGVMSKVPDDCTMSEIWEAEWQRAVVKQCMAEVRTEVDSKTMRAFELVAVNGWPADQVATELGITRNAVYLAKSHVLSRLHQLQANMEEIW